MHLVSLFLPRPESCPRPGFLLSLAPSQPFLDLLTRPARYAAVPCRRLDAEASQHARVAAQGLDLLGGQVVVGEPVAVLVTTHDGPLPARRGRQGSSRSRRPVVAAASAWAPVRRGVFSRTPPGPREEPPNAAERKVRRPC